MTGIHRTIRAPIDLRPSSDDSSVGVLGGGSGNFTEALYLRSQSAGEIEQRLGFGPGRLSRGWWLVFALEKPLPDNFDFGGYTDFSGGRIGHPRVGGSRPKVEEELEQDLGGPAQVLAARARRIATLQITRADRVAKVAPVAAGSDYPVGSGFPQFNIPHAIKCKVAAFIAPGETYLGMYT